MARQVVRVGDQLKDGKGESVRSAMVKVNLNFAELYAYLSGGDGGSLETAIPITRGGTGASTAAGARQKLGLGDVATKNTGNGEGDVMVVGEFGLGTDLSPNVINYETVKPETYKSGELSYFGVDLITAITLATRDSAVKGQIAMGSVDAVPVLKMRGSNQAFTQWYDQYGSNNAIVTANGDIKFSENSVQVHNSKVVARHKNAHEFKRNGVGTYSVTQAIPSSKLWSMVVPEGFTAAVTQSGTGFDLVVKKDGVAADIPEDTWIDINLSK